MKSGNVWELNPLGALFKPPDGFEDHGQHQLCKHSRNQLNLTLTAKGYYPRKSCAVQFCWWEPGKKTNINGKKLQIDAKKPE